MSDFIFIVISALLQLFAFTLIPLLWWLITDRKTNFFTWIGLKKPSFTSSKLKIIAVIVLTAAIYIVLMFLIMTTMLSNTSSATNQFSGKGIAAIPAILIYAIIQTSLSEELFFRGFLCKRISNKFGFVVGNIVQSLLFGLMHGIPFGVASGDIVAGILLTLLPACIGFVQGWLNEKKSDGSIIPSWILHALMNILSAITVI